MYMKRLSILLVWVKRKSISVGQHGLQKWGGRDKTSCCCRISSRREGGVWPSSRLFSDSPESFWGPNPAAWGGAGIWSLCLLWCVRGCWLAICIVYHHHLHREVTTNIHFEFLSSSNLAHFPSFSACLFRAQGRASNLNIFIHKIALKIELLWKY